MAIESESRSRPAMKMPLLGGLALLLLVAGYLFFRSTPASKAAPLEIYGKIPGFSFQTQEAAPYSPKDMLGHVSIANFIFTRCPSICPVFTMKLQRIGEDISEDIHLLSFSVDPEYDTPERLSQFAQNYSADPKRWHFLTGQTDKVKEVVEGALKISMQKNGLDENGVPDIVHGSHFVLFDSKGRIRGYYNSEDTERIDALKRDAEALSKLNK